MDALRSAARLVKGLFTPAPPVFDINDIINNQWSSWKSLWTEGVYNPDNIPIEMYERMLDTDETVFSGIEFLTMSALARLGQYTHTDQKIQDFVNENLVQMDGNFIEACGDILTALAFGFSTTEILWKTVGGQVRLRGLQTLHPKTVHLDIETEGPNKNKLKTVWQNFRGLYQATLPPDKVIHYAHRGKFGNLYGRSRLKPAFKSWFIKDVILKAWGACCERYGTPFRVGKVRGGNTMMTNPATGAQVNLFSYTSALLDKLGEKGSLAVDENTDVQLVYPTKNFGEDFHQLVGYCNTMTYRALGLPSLIADQGSTGSYSLGKQHYELFVLVLEHILNELIDTVIDQLIRRLIEMNFGPQDNYGDFTREKLQAEDEKLISEVLTNLRTSGAIDPERLDDLNWMRDRVGLPLLEEEDIQPSLPDMPPPPPPNAAPVDPMEDPQPQDDSIPGEQFSFSWAARRRNRRSARATRRAEFSQAGIPLPPG